MEARICTFCQNSFVANKYAPKQKVCSSPDCQKKRQLESMKLWREKYPNYFKYDESKGPEWIAEQRRRSKDWRERNPEKVRAYRVAHTEEYRAYMREYMKKYREKQKSQETEGPANPTTESGAV